MPGRANDLIVIPDSFWQRDQTTAALRNRDVGRLFDLLRQYAGASQTQIGMACGMNQGKVSAIARESSKSRPWPSSSASQTAWRCPTRPGLSWAWPHAQRRAHPRRPGSQHISRQGIPGRPWKRPLSLTCLASVQRTGRRKMTRCDAEPSSG